MRRLILIAAVAMASSACGRNGQQESNQIAGESLTAESIVSNDVTAIDAVTGDAANMAVDVDLNYGNPLENEPAASLTAPARPRAALTRPPARPPARPAPAAENTATTAAANTTTNTQ